METKGIKVALVLEAVGRPKSHLSKAMEELVKKVSEEKGVKLDSHKIHEPVKMKNQKEFFSSFVELEVEVEEIQYLAVLMFKYMPANVEILSPELIALTNNGWNDIFNELTRRLHGYDEVARIIQLQNAELQNRLKEEMDKKK